MSRRRRARRSLLVSLCRRRHKRQPKCLKVSPNIGVLMRAVAATGNRIGPRPPLWSKCDGQELAKDFAPGLVMFSAAVSRHSRGWGGNAGWEGKLPESASSRARLSNVCHAASWGPGKCPLWVKADAEPLFRFRLIVPTADVGTFLSRYWPRSHGEKSTKRSCESVGRPSRSG